MELFVGTCYFEIDASGEPALRSVLEKSSQVGADAPQNPSYLALHPTLPVLYSTDELLDSGVVWSYTIDRDAKQLSVLNKVDSLGTSAAFVSVSKDGRFLFVANYAVAASSPAVVFALDEQGRIGEAVSIVSCENVPDVSFPGPNEPRQDIPHPHMSIEDEAATGEERLVLIPDLGSDCVHEVTLNAQGKQTRHEYAFLPGGWGPRHVAIRASDRTRLVVCELTSMLCLVPWKAKRDAQDTTKGPLRDATQAISLLDGSDEPKSDATWTAAAIQLHPNDKFVYCSTRNMGSSTSTGRVTAFRLVDAEDDTGTRAEFVCCMNSGGNVPREMKLDPTGAFLYVAHQDSDNIECFAVDQETGTLCPDKTRSFTFGTPVGLCFSSI
ncbi:Hypothetical Protein FCC1311_095962 [Hondaea fermentalgiana]|uniref:6-phosphogluconolactonase n=1 Tax=Hondaea fermentalgiana TaxID=2315210 RepID=A0A2R5GXF3_9STRA|nr:Hypothetical Protein FCC1311_095962 [Hondaea fermentalgiana]|eukprot:GBG33373.1 Hypothetical Protein FCC1311_095962 [Hondaea fermentalgiana]